MKVALTAEDLIAFEDEIAQAFLDKKIRAPVHLSGGNEQQLIDIFEKHVDPDDWCLSQWRSHYHCLLKGVPPYIVKNAILDGRSISLCFASHRVLSTGIVAGAAPIAVGLAKAIKMKGQFRKVVCFLGDMSAESGVAYEAIKYSINWRLPILWVIEDNGLSVSTDTMTAWGGACAMMTDPDDPKIIRYSYTLTRPHVGVGEWVNF